MEIEDTFDSSIDVTFSTHSNQLPIFAACLAMWKKMEMNKLKVLSLQRKLNSILALYMKRRQRYLRLVSDISGAKMMMLLEHIRSPYQFLKLFRIKLPTFFKLKNLLYKDKLGSTGWMPEVELLLFLFWLSGGLSYKKVNKLLDISESILQTMFSSIFDRFLQHVCEVIYFPKNISYLSRGFEELTESHIFGLAVGVVDAFHVQICHREDPQYLNDANEFAVQVQSVCDHRGAFMDIAVGFPGHMLKTHVLQCTPLYLGQTFPPPGFVLLCGRGYPCLQQPMCIIPPFIKADDYKKNCFNKCHKKAHSAIVRAVGQILDRWRRIFTKPIHLPLSDITNIIISCFMIHNISLDTDDIWPKEATTNFSVNFEHVSLIESQVSGEFTQIGMSEQAIPVNKEIHIDAD